jgi:CRP-like cAMP-binding protein
MSLQRHTDPLIRNQILTALPREEYERLLARMTLVQLPRGKRLYYAGQPLRHAYFLNSGMVSLVSTSQSGSSVEVGMVGDEGCVGAPIILGMPVTPYEVNVQLEVGSACKIGAEEFQEEFNRGGKLQELMLKYIQVMLTQITQSALCNRFHTVEERLCRWFLVARDRVNANTFTLTHESIAQILGTPRTGVTMIAGHLQKEGIISYSRGRITILDPKRLQSVACECYEITRESIGDFTQNRSLVA